jgi:hypothetical protein
MVTGRPIGPAAESEALRRAAAAFARTPQYARYADLIRHYQECEPCADGVHRCDTGRALLGAWREARRS